MMAGQVNVAGTWKNISGIMVKQGGVWKAVSVLYEKKAGSWGVYYRGAQWPDNLISFPTFDGATGIPEAWEFADGAGASALDLRSTYLRGAAAQGSKWTDPGHIPANASGVTGGGGGGGVGASGSGQPTDGHNHNWYHSVKSATNSPAYVKLRAYIIHKVLTTGALLFYRGSSVPGPTWDVWTGYDGKLLMIAAADTDAIATGGGAHSHPNNSSTTGNNNQERRPPSANEFLSYNSYGYNHSHGWTGPSASGTPDPRSVSILPIKANTDKPKMSPSILGFFAGNIVPSGWLLCDGTGGAPDYRNLFLKLNAAAGWTTDSPAGADTHTDSCAASNTAAGGGSSGSGRYLYDSGSSANPHGHPVPAHNHGTTNNSVPTHTPIMICIKE